MSHKEKALQLFSDGYLCSQSVLGAFAEEYKLPIWLALQLGTCFGAGMRKGEVCGACTGALMVLGFMHSDPKDRMDACRNSDRFLDAFQKANGSYLCNELLGCDVRTQDGIQYALDQHLFTEFCPKMVGSAVEILEEFLEERHQLKR